MTSTLKTSTRQAGRHAFASWLTANVVSLAGTRLSMVALPWFVLTTTGSAAKTGLVGFAEMLPYVVAKAAGGPVIDRVGAGKVSVIADIASVVAGQRQLCTYELDPVNVKMIVNPPRSWGKLLGTVKGRSCSNVSFRCLVQWFRSTGITMRRR